MSKAKAVLLAIALTFIITNILFKFGKLQNSGTYTPLSDDDWDRAGMSSVNWH